MDTNPVKVSETAWYRAIDCLEEAYNLLKKVDGQYFDMKHDRMNKIACLYQNMKADYNWIVFGHPSS